MVSTLCAAGIGLLFLSLDSAEHSASVSKLFSQMDKSVAVDKSPE